MGTFEEAGNPPDTQAPSNVSKAESVSMDLYIDPVKERKMMLKFDVSVLVSYRCHN